MASVQGIVGGSAASPSNCRFLTHFVVSTPLNPLPQKYLLSLSSQHTLQENNLWTTHVSKNSPNTRPAQHPLRTLKSTKVSPVLPVWIQLNWFNSGLNFWVKYWLKLLKKMCIQLGYPLEYQNLYPPKNLGIAND